MSDTITTPGISTPETVTADLIDSIRKDIQGLNSAQCVPFCRTFQAATSGAMCTLTLLAQMLDRQRRASR